MQFCSPTKGLFLFLIPDKNIYDCGLFFTRSYKLLSLGIVCENAVAAARRATSLEKQTLQFVTWRGLSVSAVNLVLRRDSRRSHPVAVILLSQYIMYPGGGVSVMPMKEYQDCFVFFSDGVIGLHVSLTPYMYMYM